MDSLPQKQKQVSRHLGKDSIFLYSIHGIRQGTKAVAKLFGIAKIVTEQRLHTWTLYVF